METYFRDWLVWSEEREAWYCFPCRLFKSSVSGGSCSSNVTGWSGELGWKKHYDRVPENECSVQNYLEWRRVERQVLERCTIDIQLEEEILSAVNKWRQILKSIIDIVLFLGERGLAFCGSSQRIIGSPNHRNFLGIVELLSCYDRFKRACHKSARITNIISAFIRSLLVI